MSKDISILINNKEQPSFEEAIIHTYWDLSSINNIKKQLDELYVTYENMLFIANNFKQYKKDKSFEALTDHQFTTSQEVFQGLSKAFKEALDKLKEFVNKFFEWVDITFGMICKNGIAVLDKYQKILKDDKNVDRLKEYETKVVPVTIYIHYLINLIAYGRKTCETINNLKNINNPEDISKVDELKATFENLKNDKDLTKTRDAYEEATKEDNPKTQDISQGGWMSESNISALKDQFNNCISARQNIVRYKSTCMQMINALSNASKDDQKALNKSKEDFLKDLITKELSTCLTGLNKLVIDSSKIVQQLIKEGTGKSETEVK